MDASKFGFQPNIQNLENYMKDNQSSEGDGPQINWWSIPHGMSSIRILPPWDPTGRVALPVYSHPIEYQGNGMKYKKYSWTCVNKTFGKPCNICEGLKRINAAGIDTSDYEPSRRTFYTNVIVMFDPIYDRDLKAGKKPEQCDGVAPGTHVLMRMPKTIYDWVVTSITNPMIGDITSVTNGIDVYITKEGSGLSTTYTPTLSPNGRTAIPQEYLDKIENLYNLDDIFSTGFEDEQVTGLINSLNAAPAAFQQGVPQMAAQMSGYPQQPVQQPMYGQPMVPPQSTTAAPPNPWTAPVPTAAPNPWSAPAAPAPQAPAANDDLPWINNAPTPQAPPIPQPVAPSVQTSGNPECFGRYNPGDVKCVTCPMEINCQSNSK